MSEDKCECPACMYEEDSRAVVRLAPKADTIPKFLDSLRDTEPDELICLVYHEGTYRLEFSHTISKTRVLGALVLLQYEVLEGGL